MDSGSPCLSASHTPTLLDQLQLYSSNQGSGEFCLLLSHIDVFTQFPKISTLTMEEEEEVLVQQFK